MVIIYISAFFFFFLSYLKFIPPRNSFLMGKLKAALSFVYTLNNFFFFMRFLLASLLSIFRLNFFETIYSFRWNYPCVNYTFYFTVDITHIKLCPV